MTNERYLSHFRPDLLSGSVDEMAESGRLQDRVTLIEYLGGALDHLRTVPGPHLQYRRGHADDWIGWWIDFLKKDGVVGRLVRFDKIKGSLTQGVEHGVLFAGGMEGHRGHRFAVDHMLKHVRPILLMEGDSYVESKTRGGPYLDLRARVSMWANYDPRVVVSVLPEMPAGVVPSVYYKNLFDQTGADYCFASKSDSDVWEKVARGKPALFTPIPGVSIQHTTDKVERLWEEDDLDKWLNTTKHVTKMFPDPGEELLDNLLMRTERDLTEV